MRPSNGRRYARCCRDDGGLWLRSDLAPAQNIIDGRFTFNLGLEYNSQSFIIVLYLLLQMQMQITNYFVMRMHGLLFSSWKTKEDALIAQKQNQQK